MLCLLVKGGHRTLAGQNEAGLLLPVREGRADAAVIAASSLSLFPLILGAGTMLATIGFAKDALVFAEDSAIAPDLTADAEIARCVQIRLGSSCYAPLRADVTCNCRNGVLTLMGNLPSFFLAQKAQSVALHAPGVERVVNRIRVG
jgi:hypothetical protein